MLGIIRLDLDAPELPYSIHVIHAKGSDEATSGLPRMGLRTALEMA
jgi:hypothetical protein